MFKLNQPRSLLFHAHIKALIENVNFGLAYKAWLVQVIELRVVQMVRWCRGDRFLRPKGGVILGVLHEPQIPERCYLLRVPESTNDAWRRSTFQLGIFANFFLWYKRTVNILAFRLLLPKTNSEFFLRWLRFTGVFCSLFMDDSHSGRFILFLIGLVENVAHVMSETPVLVYWSVMEQRR